MRRSKKFSGGYIAFDTGREGPKHDPYGYQEYSISRKNGDEATLHLGLAEWLEVNGEKLHSSEVKLEYLVEYFEEICRISLRTFERTIHHNMACCSRPKPIEVAGYPGETLTMCDHCGNTINYSFSEGVIY